MSAKVLYGKLGDAKAAVKVARNAEHSGSVLHEAVALSTLEHNHVLGLLALCLDQRLPQMLTAYCPKGDLHSYLRLRPEASVGPSRLKHFALGVARGLEYLAARSIVHNDISARNVLVDLDYTTKISDFALAYWPGLKQPPPKRQALPVRWAAPECLREEEGAFVPAADMWSFGVLLFEVYSQGSRPYNHCSSNAEVEEGIREGTLRLERPPRAPDEVNTIINNMCLVQPASARAPCSDVCEALSRVPVPS